MRGKLLVSLRICFKEVSVGMVVGIDDGVDSGVSVLNAYR